jgi:hypothetical protein
VTLQANVAKHAPHGSKLLEQAPSPLVAQLQTKLAVGLSKLPFAHTLVVPDTDANPPVYRRALQQDMQLGGMFGAVGDECKAILSAVGMDAAQMDNDAYDPQLPAHLQQCEGVLSMAMCAPARLFFVRRYALQQQLRSLSLTLAAATQG